MTGRDFVIVMAIGIILAVSTVVITQAVLDWSVSDLPVGLGR